MECNIDQAVAKDSDGKNVEQPVDIMIKVIDQNDNKPEFTSSTFYGYVAEGATPGTSFMNITATDKDQKDSLNGIIRYSILSQEPELPSRNMFTISSQTGLITVQSTGLDRELVNKYTLTIRAADLEGAGLFAEATAIITITDTNDNAPQFETKERLDYEKSKQHRVIIEVRNQIPLTSTMPLSSATVIINVLDVNEAPIFDPETKVDKKSENLPVGSTVTSCSAKDPDNAQDQIV
eukprot:g42635.t1